MKEVPVGETFEYGGKEYLVVKDVGHNCMNCGFLEIPCSGIRDSVQACSSEKRIDGTKVTFVPYKDYILKRLGAKP